MTKLSRKNFLFSGLSLTAIASFFTWGTQPKKPKTAKFLTQDGKLVEIEVDKLPAAAKAATKEDVQNWIKR